MSDTAQIQLPPKLIPVFSKKYRYRGSYGGRGSAKSFSFAKMAAVFGYQRPMKILCARELQNSIKDSVHSGIVAAIESEPWLADHYEWGESFIRGKNGTTFIFKGLRHNAKEIKSTADIDLCWVEEAEAVSESSWSVLIPTIRKPNSEIWLTWNPEDSESATSRRFLQNPPEDSCIVEMNWSDNYWFPEELEAERVHDLKHRPDTYSHIWEGAFLEITEAQVFKGKYDVAEFDETRMGNPYHGIDFGFARDPTTAVQCFICDNMLHIRRACGKVGLELDYTAEFVKGAIPAFERYVSRADSARPESISYLKRHGLPRIEGVKKWPGSVEDGIDFMKSFDKIIIHPDCTEVIKEFRHYSFKVDKNTGDILPVIVDAFNHYCFTGETLVSTARGDTRIDSLDSDDMILTRCGYKPLRWHGKTGDNEVYEVEFGDGTRLRGTAKHKIFTTKGKKALSELMQSDMVYINQEDTSCKNNVKKLNTTGMFTGVIQTAGLAGIILKGLLLAASKGFMSMCGKIITGLSRTASIFTTKMATGTTTPSKTLSASLHVNISGTTNSAFAQTKTGQHSKRLGHLLLNGIGARRGVRGTGSTERRLIKAGSQERLSASNAGLHLKTYLCMQDFAQTLVSRHGAEKAESMMSKEHVSLAERITRLINTRKLKRVPVRAVVRQGVEPTYNLETDSGLHEFFANGVLVANCDAIRYALAPMIKNQQGSGMLMF